MLRSFNNSDKGSVSHAIVHRALWEYLVAINDLEDEAERDKVRRNIFERYVVDTLRDPVPLIHL